MFGRLLKRLVEHLSKLPANLSLKPLLKQLFKRPFKAAARLPSSRLSALREVIVALRTQLAKAEADAIRYGGRMRRSDSAIWRRRNAGKPGWTVSLLTWRRPAGPAGGS